MLQPMINKEIIIQKRLSNQISLLKTDPVQIEQLLINLLINARDAIEIKKHFSSKKKIIIETKNVYINKQYTITHPEAREGQYILISISDNGTGMDEQTKQHIFEPFFSTKRQDKGTGMGLTTVYSIVKQNEGFILINSEKGSGSTFNIYLPSISICNITTSSPLQKVVHYKIQKHIESVI